MRLHRFYIGDVRPAGSSITITDTDLIHQWKNVFRMKEKSEAILFGKNGIEYTTKINSIDKKVAVFEVLNEEKGPVAKRNITLYAAIIKKDNFEVIVQKAIEIGVTSIIPIISDRSEKKLLNKIRLDKIAIEATEQCGRVDVPIIGDPMPFSNALAAISKDTTVIGFEPKGKPFDSSVFSNNKLSLFIGPEGGWTDDEIKELGNIGVVMNMPTFILRAETAAIAALTLAVTLA